MTVNNGATWAAESGGNIVAFTSYATANTFGNHLHHTDLTDNTTTTGGVTAADIRVSSMWITRP